MMTAQPVSPTPREVYQPRIWKVRIWTKGGPFEGTRVFFKAPYGVYMTAVQVLARAVATGTIARFTFGPATKRDFATLDRRTLRRFDEAFASFGLDLNA
jgi:hypothetical protein